MLALTSLTAAQTTAPAPVSPADPVFDAKCTPTVTLGEGEGDYRVDPDPARKSAFFDVAGSNPEAFMQDIGRKVCHILYRKASEIRQASHLTLVLSPAVGEVSFKSGDGADITVILSTDYLNKVKKEGGDVGSEIRGILFHEMTHMYQQDDSDLGGADGGLIEGIADSVRYRAGFMPGDAEPDKDGHWNDGYSTTAFFLLWLEKRFPDFIYKLNLSMDSQDNIKWTPDAFRVLTGKTVDQLWNEYKTSPD
ncbi:basic secretory protein-like protein [Deinococcus marmoris]|uniref:PKD domain protein n=1 Tax=Deinococcus marmoris TaxID=249408 RepID=A0A1U7NZI0_9DEIO|nr:basic secretory protein-like protein [Deinococcus marmoris]OLV18323.1 PKD domain protein [Deinococcus marmoris]